MNETDHWEARAGGVGDRGPTTIGVPAEDLTGELQAAHGVCAPGKLHATSWQMEDIRSACCIEHVGPFEEARKRLAVPAIAEETEAGARRNIICETAQVAALAAKRELLWDPRHKT